MSTKYFTGRKGHYIFCDICGQACYDFEATLLKLETGRGGLLVCPKDADIVDFGLIPYTPRTEHPIPWMRGGDQDVTNAASVLNYETTHSLGV